MTPSSDRPSPAQMFLQFVRAVFDHWMTFLTSGVAAAVLAFVPELLGHPFPRYVYALVGIIGGLVMSSYRAWRDEHQRADRAEHQVELLDGSQKRDAEKRELIRLITELQAMEKKLPYWRGFAQTRWGTDPEPEELTPEDPSPILHWAEKIQPGLRNDFENVLENVELAERLIRETLKRNANFRQEGVIREIYKLLDQSIPALSKVVEAFRSFEAQL